MSLPIRAEPTQATTFCTCSRLAGSSKSNWAGARPNSALISGMIFDSKAASIIQSKPGTGTMLAAPATNARRCSSLRLRCTAASRVALPAASCTALAMGVGLFPADQVVDKQQYHCADHRGDPSGRIAGLVPAQCGAGVVGDKGACNAQQGGHDDAELVFAGVYRPGNPHVLCVD
eukprot:Opistho-1_new@15357